MEISSPLVITQAAFALLQVADTLMVSGLGKSALAAIGPAGLTTFALATLGTGILTIPHTEIGKASGRGDRWASRTLAHQSVWLSVALGVGILAFYPTAPVVFGLYGHAPSTTALQIAYFEVSLFGLLPQFVAVALSNYFLGTLRPKRVMACVLASIGINIALNYGLIYGNFGFPELGFVGAAWGTALSSFAYAIIIGVVFVLSDRATPKRTAKRNIVDFSVIGGYLRRGIPIGVQDVIETISWGLLVVVLAGRYGDAHGAAASVLIRCMQLSFLPIEGLGMGLMSLVSNSIGAGDHERAKAQTLTAFRIAAKYMVSMAIIFFVFRGQIISLFTSDQEVIRIASVAIICVCLLQLFDAMGITHIYALFGAGDTAWPSLVNIALGVVVLLGGSLALGHLFPQLTSLGVWIAAATFTMLQGLILRARWRSGVWEGIRFLDKRL